MFGFATSRKPPSILRIDSSITLRMDMALCIGMAVWPLLTLYSGSMSFGLARKSERSSRDACTLHTNWAACGNNLPRCLAECSLVDMLSMGNMLLHGAARQYLFVAITQSVSCNSFLETYRPRMNYIRASGSAWSGLLHGRCKRYRWFCRRCVLGAFLSDAGSDCVTSTGLLLRNLNQVPRIQKPCCLLYIHNMATLSVHIYIPFKGAI